MNVSCIIYVTAKCRFQLFKTVLAHDECFLCYMCYYTVNVSCIICEIFLYVLLELYLKLHKYVSRVYVLLQTIVCCIVFAHKSCFSIIV